MESLGKIFDKDVPLSQLHYLSDGKVEDEFKWEEVKA